MLRVAKSLHNTDSLSGFISYFVIFSVDHINGSSDFESGDLVSTITRVMVSQNRLYSDSEEVLALQVFSEVIEVEGKQVTLQSKQLNYHDTLLM